jgi:hypothetical protein
VLATIAVIVEMTDAHKVLVKIGAYEALILGVLGSPSNLGPKLLEILHVVLKVGTNVMLALMGDVNASLHLDLLLVVVFDVFLKYKLVLFEKNLPASFAVHGN